MTKKNLNISIPNTIKCNLDKDKFAANALEIIKKLTTNGFEAYFVGGCIRDLLLGVQPKDFDIVTCASPEEIKNIFHNCRLIGRRFRLAHIYFDKEIIEVATFRTLPQDENDDHAQNAAGIIMRDNVYGTINEDVWRRDFRINALYYCPQKKVVLDYTGGMQDIEQKSLQMIGNPEKRYKEDPVRILRAIRLSNKLGLEIAKETKAPIKELAHLIAHVSSARIFEELMKLLLTGYAQKNYHALKEFELLQYLLPLTLEATELNDTAQQAFIESALISTDKRANENKPINPAFLLAVFLWGSYKLRLEEKLEMGIPFNEAKFQAQEDVIREQIISLAIPRRLTFMIKQIWELQFKIVNIRKQNIQLLFTHKRFRAAYDFLLLRVEAGENKLSMAANWWTKYQEANDKDKKKLINKLEKNEGKKFKKNYPRKSKKIEINEQTPNKDCNSHFDGWQGKS